MLVPNLFAKSFLRVVVVAAAVLLAACSTSDDGDDSDQGLTAHIAASPNPGIGYPVALDASASTNPRRAALTYSWSLTSAPAGSTAQLTDLAVVCPTLTPDAVGDYVVALSVSDGQRSSSTTASFNVPQPQIVFDQAEPVSGTVTLSVNGGMTGDVAWHADLISLGNGAMASGRPMSWNAAAAGNAQHVIVARVQTGNGGSVEIRRNVTVANASVTLSNTVSGTSGMIDVDVRAASMQGIASVSGTLDEGATVTLSAPNACGLGCNIYRFSFDADAIGSGSHAVLIAAVDGGGNTGHVSVALPVVNPPALTVTDPIDGTIVYGQLRVRGTATSDRGEVVTTSASLGDLPFLTTTASTFVGTLDLASVVPGPYTLKVRSTDASQAARDVQRSIVVASSAALGYSSSLRLPPAGRVLAVGGSTMAYAAGNRDVVLHDLTSGARVTLSQTRTIDILTDWQVADGRAYASGRGADCANYCIYAWAGDGSATNLSNANPYSGGTAVDIHPIARGDWVVWGNDASFPSGHFTVYQVSTNAFRQVSKPAGANYLGNWAYDIAEIGGVVHFYFWAQTGSDGVNSVFEIFEWRSDTGASVQLTHAGRQSTYSQTDGDRVAWREAASGIDPDGTFSLLARNVAGGASATFSDHATDAMLANGVLAWAENAGGAKAVKAATTPTIATLATSSSSVLYANGGGQVIFGENGKVFSWSSATGETTLRFEAAPAQVFVADGHLLLNVNAAIYWVPL